MRNSTKTALENYFKKQIKSTTKRPKNKQPEKEVVKALLHWLKLKNFYCVKVEAQAVYSEKIGIYHHGQTDPGHPDIAGCTPNGLACYVEAKAPGRLKTLIPAQYDFLIQIIERGGFAVCVDSVEMLSDLWDKFRLAENKKELLKANLQQPKSASSSSSKLFED